MRIKQFPKTNEGRQVNSATPFQSMVINSAASMSGVSKLALTIAQNQLRKNGERGTMELLTKRGLLIEYDLARGYGLSLEQTLFIRAFIECGGAKEAAERLTKSTKPYQKISRALQRRTALASCTRKGATL